MPVVGDGLVGVPLLSVGSAEAMELVFAGRRCDTLSPAAGRVVCWGLELDGGWHWVAGVDAASGSASIVGAVLIGGYTVARPGAFDHVVLDSRVLVPSEPVEAEVDQRYTLGTSDAAALSVRLRVPKDPAAARVVQRVRPAEAVEDAESAWRRRRVDGWTGD